MSFGLNYGIMEYDHVMSYALKLELIPYLTRITQPETRNSHLFLVLVFNLNLIHHFHQFGFRDIAFVEQYPG